MEPLVQSTARGLYCAAGDFYVDPWQRVERAVITHAHTDHARWGNERYLTTPTGAVVLKARFGKQVEGRVDALAYGEKTRMGDVEVSLHPAGHVLGSAQVRIERVGGKGAGETWVLSGDYKTQDDGVSEPLEVVRCHTFITESTFGLPIYRWKPQEEIYRELNAWWRANAERGVTCLIACYALGKAQRLMAGLDPGIGPILMHGALCSCTQAYRDAGVGLPDVRHATQALVKAAGGRALVLAPPSAVRSPWAAALVKQTESKELANAMASGWMTIRGARRRRTLDTGFALSDHADWPGLMATIVATGAERVGVTHGSIGAVVRYLHEKGKDAFGIETHFEGEGGAEESSANVDPPAPLDAGSGEACP